jgi:hypothetical protein
MSGMIQTTEARMLAAGVTKADIQHCGTLAALPEEALSIVLDAAMQASKRAERSTARALLKTFELDEYGRARVAGA